MIEIVTLKGEKYSFDPRTERIFKDGLVLPSTEAEPLYSNVTDPNSPPKFSGLLLKTTNSILSLSGKINPVTDPNTIS